MLPRNHAADQPKLLDISALLAGEVRTFTFERKFLIDLEDADCTVSEPATMTGELINRAGYITFDAKLFVPFTAVCCRCLDEVCLSCSLKIHAPVAERLENSENEEYIIPNAGRIDLEELARIHLLLHLPYRHLCREDCKGLCPRCGKNLNREACSCQTEDSSNCD